MKTVSKKRLSAMLAFGLVFLPGVSTASSVYIDTGHTEYFVGDTILFSVRVDSGGQTINTVEGGISLDHAADAVALTDINTAGSQFSLWPTKPVPSERNTRISFAGGSPGGFVSEDAIIFNVVLRLEKAGQIAFSPDSIGVYLNDGKGTKDQVSVRDLIIDVLPRASDEKLTDDWSALLTADQTPPEPFEIYMGQDDSVFDGKKFLSFGTTDKQSGISHYEVTEGSLPPVRSSDTYVLQEQNAQTNVKIAAYDSAGNAREVVYSPASEGASFPVVPILIGIIVLIIIIAVVLRGVRKMRTHI